MPSATPMVSPSIQIKCASSPRGALLYFVLMALTHHSHRNTGTGAGGTIISQQSRRSSAVRGVSLQWTQIVGSGEPKETSSSAPLSPPTSCEQFVHSCDNGISSDDSNNSPVSWPTLSESTKASPKSPFSDSVSVSQGMGMASASHRDGGQWGGFESQSHGANSNRRGNCCAHPRGDRNRDWKPHTSWGNMPSQRVPTRPFIPHTYPPFIPTPILVKPYRIPMAYSEFYFPCPFPDSLRVPLLFPHAQLHTRIVNQIDYYFSKENLVKDKFLRQKMDEHGWVPVTLIAGFNKVRELTDNMQLILNVVRSSTVVEVQGEKLRQRNDWFRWLIPPSIQNSNVSSPSVSTKV
ncbi:hypothetical protein HAX54_014597 [Datura stramonium]|uniref:HTH La-type RNA-binding domain-containing protein n=1 Tax=Datura stramonium TaxID=4076 RepID=A0ABS8RZF2_DATST|nr:hypothetical protein [Datura stramonium]